MEASRRQGDTVIFLFCSGYWKGLVGEKPALRPLNQDKLIPSLAWKKLIMFHCSLDCSHNNYSSHSRVKVAFVIYLMKEPNKGSFDSWKPMPWNLLVSKVLQNLDPAIWLQWLSCETNLNSNILCCSWNNLVVNPPKQWLQLPECFPGQFNFTRLVIYYWHTFDCDNYHFR